MRLTARRLNRATLARMTLHAVAAADYPPFHGCPTPTPMP
jgi:hypothetical protein